MSKCMLEGFVELTNNGVKIPFSNKSGAKLFVNEKNGAGRLVLSDFVPNELLEAERVGVAFNKESKKFCLFPSNTGTYVIRTHPSLGHVINSVALTKLIAKTYGVKTPTPSSVSLDTAVMPQFKGYFIIRGLITLDNM